VGGAQVTLSGELHTINLGIVFVNLSCTTSTVDGRCSFTSLPTYKIDPNAPGIVLEVSNVQYGMDPYVSSLNHDEEGDSDGTTIVVQRPP
jgi:hypothetical protein